MYKKLLTFFISVFITTIGLAQSYTNNWINYTQQYYKIKITENRIYRIDSLTLVSAGIPISSINPKNIQLFNKGKEQHIYIEGESDGVFNSTDFIEFYGEYNDGKLDSLIYFNTPTVPNPYFSNFSDTAVYYLTWNTSVNNKRILLENDTAYSSYNPINYFYNEEFVERHNGYYSGETDLFGGSDCKYTKTEGWFDSAIELGNQQEYSLNTNNVYSSGPTSFFRSVVVGASKDIAILGSQQADHHLTIEMKGITNSYTNFKDTLFKGYALNIFNEAIQSNTLGNITTSFRYSSVADASFTSNRTVFSYAKLKYPHTFNLEGRSKFLMFVPDNTQNKSLVTITNFSGGGDAYIYDLSNAKKIPTTYTNNAYSALLTNSGNEKRCLIIANTSILLIPSIQPVTPNAFFTNFGAQAVDSAFLIVTHKSLIQEATNYKTYRSSVSGGSHNVVLADVDELYDQFAYGIVKSPLSIRCFADFILGTYPSPPQNLFLLGKAVKAAQIRFNSVNYSRCLVPSFGYLASDNLLTAGLHGAQNECAIPTGRIAANNPSEVALYLNKVQQYEATPPDEWKKQVMHFGGGNSASEQNQLKNYLNAYADTIKKTYYGANVVNYFKTSSAPIQIITSVDLTTRINNGVSIMTFFGHSTATGFDQGIDNVNSYNPLPGHYPFVIANSCYVGDIHDEWPSSSEAFVLTANRGMIGYLGSVSLGYPYALDVYTRLIYSNISRRNYNKSIGSSIQKTIKTIQTSTNPNWMSDYYIDRVINDMTLQCDPSIKINTFSKPDYKISNPDVSFDLTSTTDKIIIKVARTNIGMAIDSNSVTSVLRTFPNGETQTYLKICNPLYYKDTIIFTVDMDYVRGVGLNKFKVKLDRNETIDELNENNNETTDIDLIINGNGIEPIYPYRFAIIPTDTITLKAYTGNPFAVNKNYIFQIDTSDLFDSPFMESTIINAPGGVVRWRPNIIFTDSTVYYWRVTPDSISPSNSFSWQAASFQYINNRKGWEQAHLFQYKNDKFQYVKLNRAQRKFDFVNDIKSLHCSTGSYPYVPIDDISFKINNTIQSVWTCLDGGSNTRSGFTFVLFDMITGDPIVSVYDSTTGTGQFGDVHCSPDDYITFEFWDDDPAWRSKITAFLDAQPDGMRVLGYSESFCKFSQYEPSLNTAFQKIGALNMNALHDSMPYIIYGIKSSNAQPGAALEVIGDSIQALVSIDTVISTNWTNGSISSPIIGPAKAWRSFHWRQTTLDGATTADSIVIRLIGIKANGQEDMVRNFTKDSLDVLSLATIVDATIYPNIRLVAYLKDDSLNTPAQLKRWQVIYDQVPEAAINPALGYSISQSSVQQGDNITVRLPYENVSDLSFTDSMLVTYWIEDANNVRHPLADKLKKKPFDPNEVIMDTIQFNTSNFSGHNALMIELNPINQPKSQLEQYHFNNVARIPFTSEVDRINPLLDVTFDGIHILNYDIVSAKPNILVKLKDENRFLALNDTSNFKLFILQPNQQVEQQIFFSTNLLFTPAQLPKNSCTINYLPLFNADGMYQLRVQATDKSGNQSGTIDYRIKFEIVNRSTITEVMNYPNPFTTSTRFVFTLTGSETPSNFKIQIMNITGKVVKEIFGDELGPIHIGRNITEYAWDGKDEFGDRLANGVYLYRVITKINGEDIEKRESGADEYFKKGWGKMYLMR